MTDLKVECVLKAHAMLGECPLWSVERLCLFWIDIDNQTFHRFDPKSKQCQNWPLPAKPGSFVLDEGGNAVIAMQEGIYDFDYNTGICTKIIGAPYDVATMRFNDGRTDRKGRYWVGSMPVSFEGDAAELLGSYYCFNGNSLTQQIEGVHHANGTAFSLDGQTMYRAETLQRKIFAYDFDVAKGTVSNERIFAIVPQYLGMPDGATIDDEGGYWSALPAGPNGGSIARFTSEGLLDFVIDLPVAIGTMPAFGGPDMSTLFVTTGRLETMIGKQPTELSGGIFAIETPFRGIPEVPFKRR